MYTIINHIPVQSEHGDAFEARFQQNLEHMREVPGLVSVHVWRPTSDDPQDASGAYMVQTIWEDEASFRAWVGSPSFRASHRAPMPDAWRAGDAHMSKHALAMTLTR